MNKLNFEKNLPHQTRAVSSTIFVFQKLEIKYPIGVDKNYINPEIDFDNYYYEDNILKIQEENSIEKNVKKDSNIIDIMMETGTGKTYTYTKTIFELNKHFGIFKFIIVVPTLSIKAGTINFLRSQSCKEHFKEQYNKSLKLHIVQSKRSGKNKKFYMPSSISSFVNAGNFEKDSIAVMIINAGMLNSKTMQDSFDTTLFDKYKTPFEAIGALKPFVIVDEPHKFAKANKTWENILNMKPQFIFRYGATFPDKEIKFKDPLTRKIQKRKVKDYQNLIYKLSAVDAFNQNLVKGVIGHITEFEEGKNAIVKFINSDGKKATFELFENHKKKIVELFKKDSLSKIHMQMSDLFVENLNKTTVILSNGLELKKGDKINPYSYAQKLQEIMLEKAIKEHFKIEKEFLTKEVKIKPLTLFFIDNIDEYRSKTGYIKTTIERLIKAEIENLLKSQTDGFYKEYLQKSLKDISLTHAGYFSKDNSQKDEVIEKEINEILHDKSALLDLNNPRRFIFSKWTLREGWDNPNVFGICKLRSSGSEISKLQEVGRGLRLPVNEYGNRVKDKQFYLNYFVDFTESDFIEKLVSEINEKSDAISIEEKPEKLHENMIKKICNLYHKTEEELLEELDEKNIINRTNKFKENGFEYIKRNFPLIFEGVNSNKVRKSTQSRRKVTIRVQKYQELKELWEKLNEKVILEYKFENEDSFKTLLVKFFEQIKDSFTIEGVRQRLSKVEIKEQYATYTENFSVLDNQVIPIATMKYSDFLKELSSTLKINLKTIHQAFIESKIDINPYLNPTTIRVIRQNFDNFLMFNAIDKFSIEYKKVSNSIHPTKLTDKQGNVLNEVLASDIGILYSDEKVAKSYLFDELFYDSQLEKENIQQNIDEVVVFTKIPKNSIKIPVAGGKSYSPDFAYVLNYKNGKKRINFIVETKNVDNKNSLRNEEKQKIRHAELFFNQDVKIEFRTQFSSDKIVNLIKEIMQGYE